jgi:hypothetical protein
VAAASSTIARAGADRCGTHAAITMSENGEFADAAGG